MKGNIAEYCLFFSVEAEGKLSYFGKDDRIAGSFICVHSR